MDPHLLRVLLADNRWLEGEPADAWYAARLPPSGYVPRRLRPESDGRVALIVGPRQCGKSTLLRKTLAERGQPVLFLDCEDPSIRDWLRSPAAFLADLKDLGREVPGLFFEECQALDEAGRFLKGLVDRRTGRPIYATGSSSFDLEAKTRESLAGRARRHLLLPFSIAEISATLDAQGALHRQQLTERVRRLLVYGGYPTVYLAEHPDRELAGLVEAFVVRDASDRFRIRHTAAFRKVLELAASQIGNLCNFSEWGVLAGISNDTVADYCRILEETHVLRLIRPFVGGKRAEITHAPKVFFVDNGIRNQLFAGFQPFAERADRGVLLENFVFGELAKHLNPLLDSVRYWRSKSGAEVDFVLEHQGRRIGCEVKAGDARGRIRRSARSFIEAYRPELFLVVHGGAAAETSVGSTRVRFLGVMEIGETIEEAFGPGS